LWCSGERDYSRGEKTKDGEGRGAVARLMRTLIFVLRSLDFIL
jgi:hypothetical protein